MEDRGLIFFPLRLCAFAIKFFPYPGVLRGWVANLVHLNLFDLDASHFFAARTA
jgi:hypothetical protein